MSEEEFEKHKEAVAVKRLEKPKKLSSLTSIFWREIVSQLYHFDRDNVEVEYMRTLNKQDIIQHYEVSVVHIQRKTSVKKVCGYLINLLILQELIKHDAAKRHKLSVQIVPAKDSTFELRSEDAAMMDNGKVAEELYPSPTINTPVSNSLLVI